MILLKPILSEVPSALNLFSGPLQHSKRENPETNWFNRHKNDVNIDFKGEQLTMSINLSVVFQVITFYLGKPKPGYPDGYLS